MKKYATLLIIIASALWMSSFAQSKDTVIPHATFDTKALEAYRNAHKNLEPVIISFHVEEKINMKFGGRTTTYNVPNLNLINTNDLGPNNTRFIIPKLANPKETPVTLINDKPSNYAKANKSNGIKSDSLLTLDRKPSKMFVDINILNTYERTLEKGFISIEMLKRVGDRAYFEGNLVEAANWYSQLFELTTDLEPAYYYRYAMSLVSVSDLKKARQMMKLYEEKSVRK
ncbi:hypothetical protein ACSVH2_10520 [Flavobacterium sp. RSB2_4_14]|uniref:hypothetical protein n=1 Tax=Flavobacterium sp. RSB2_4_14 TaxID=3447665 RepID=UPI003F330BC9